MKEFFWYFPEIYRGRMRFDEIKEQSVKIEKTDYSKQLILEKDRIVASEGAGLTNLYILSMLCLFIKKASYISKLQASFDHLSGETNGLYWGTTKVDLKCIWLQFNDMKIQNQINETFAKNVVSSVIPNIKKCWPLDVRNSYANSGNAAYENATRLQQESNFSTTKIIFGGIGVSVPGFHDVLEFSLTLYVSGSSNNPITELRSPDQWEQHFQVR